MMNNNQNEATATGNLFAMLGQLYAENQLLRQEIAALRAQLQQVQTNGKEPEESAEVAKKAKV